MDEGRGVLSACAVGMFESGLIRGLLCPWSRPARKVPKEDEQASDLAIFFERVLINLRIFINQPCLAHQWLLTSNLPVRQLPEGDGDIPVCNKYHLNIHTRVKPLDLTTAVT